MLQELRRANALPESAQVFQDTMRILNQAAHGTGVGPDAATKAVAAGSQFLDDLRALGDP